MSQPEKNLEKSQRADKAVAGSTVANGIIAQFHNSDELKPLERVDPQVSKLYERLAGVDEKIRSLERDVYGFKASALGIANPDIRTISLKHNEQFPSNTVGTEGPTFIGYTVVGIDEKTVSIRVDVRNARNNVVQGGIVCMLPVDPGKVERVTPPIVGMPHLLMTILERPTPDTVVIAVGQSEPDVREAKICICMQPEGAGSENNR